MDKRKGNTDLTEGKVWKVIVRFAVPLLVGNLLQQFYNITDSIIVGQFLGKEALAAVSASFFIYYFIIGFFDCNQYFVFIVIYNSAISFYYFQFSPP